MTTTSITAASLPVIPCAQSLANSPMPSAGDEDQSPKGKKARLSPPTVAAASSVLSSTSSTTLFSLAPLSASAIPASLFFRQESSQSSAESSTIPQAAAVEEVDEQELNLAIPDILTALMSIKENHDEEGSLQSLEGVAQSQFKLKKHLEKKLNTP